MSNVDYFIVTESTITFSNKPKEMIFDKNRHLFKEFEHRIIYNPVDDTPETNSPWDREIWQRNAIKRAIDGIAKDDDIIITGDLDEIPNISDIENWYRPNLMFHPLMKMYFYYFNMFKERNWYGSTICNYGLMKNWSVDDMRNMKNIGISMYDKGWHFSYMGGEKIIREKLTSFSHTEFDNDFIKNNIAYNINTNRDLFFRGDLQLVEIDETYPEYIRNHQVELSQFIKKV